MPGWQIPGVPPIPTVVDLLKVMQLQAEMMAELPETLAELAKAVRGLAETVEATKDTVAKANRVVERLEVLVDELQDPVRGLRPGLKRVTEVLEAPVVQRLPAILESLESTVMPVALRAERMRNQLAAFGDRRRRVTSRMGRPSGG